MQNRKEVEIPISLFLYHPVFDISLCGIEVDADLGDWLSTEGETLAIVLEIDLLHSCLSILVQFQFDDVEVCLREQHDIDPTPRRMNLHIHQIICEKREDDKEHLLIMPLIIRNIAIRHSTQEILQEMQSSVHIPLVESLCNAASRVRGSKRVASYIRWMSALVKPTFTSLLGTSFLFLLFKTIPQILFQLLFLHMFA